MCKIFVLPVVAEILLNNRDHSFFRPVFESDFCFIRGLLNRRYLSAPLTYNVTMELLWMPLNVAFQWCMTCHGHSKHVACSEQKQEKFSIFVILLQLFFRSNPKFKMLPFGHYLSKFGMSYHFGILMASTLWIHGQIFENKLFWSIFETVLKAGWQILPLAETLPGFTFFNMQMNRAPFVPQKVFHCNLHKIWKKMSGESSL